LLRRKPRLRGLPLKKREKRRGFKLKRLKKIEMQS
jgi:hypothetical protein